jgi:hypothetical protein
MSNDYRFEWKCSYLNTVDYEMRRPDGSRLNIEERTDATEYERRIFNGDEAEWTRDVLALVGTIHPRTYGETLTAEDVAAFNAWRAHKNFQACAEMMAQPDRYGVTSPTDFATLCRSTIVRAANPVHSGLPWPEARAAFAWRFVEA